MPLLYGEINNKGDVRKSILKWFLFVVVVYSAYIDSHEKKLGNLGNKNKIKSLSKLVLTK